jgi:hypothetical protein
MKKTFQSKCFIEHEAHLFSPDPFHSSSLIDILSLLAFRLGERNIRSPSRIVEVHMVTSIYVPTGENSDVSPVIMSVAVAVISMPFGMAASGAVNDTLPLASVVT